MKLDPETGIYRTTASVGYKPDTGELIEEVDGVIRSITKVRKDLFEEGLRQAVIFELRRMGYTVIEPENPSNLPS